MEKNLDITKPCYSHQVLPVPNGLPYDHYIEVPLYQSIRGLQVNKFCVNLLTCEKLTKM